MQSWTLNKSKLDKKLVLYTFLRTISCLNYTLTSKQRPLARYKFTMQTCTVKSDVKKET